MTEGQIQFNGHHWVVFLQGAWLRIVNEIPKNHEIKVNFND